MNTTRTIRRLAIVLALASASTANAQQTPAGATGKTMPFDGNLFVSVNVGAQTQSSSSSHEFGFPLYRETATVTSSTTVGGGPIFDVSAGYKFWSSFGVAVGYSSFSETGTAEGTASIPNPLFFNRPATVTLNPVEAERSDRNVYVVLVGFWPVAEKMDLSVFLGPSFTHVKQRFIGDGDVTVQPGTQNVASTTQTQSGTSKGVNIGADLAYQFRPQVGAGFFLRYNGGSADLDGLENVDVGGLQFGVGARLRF